jgi:hypothetical protein
MTRRRGEGRHDSDGSSVSYRMTRRRGEGRPVPWPARLGFAAPGRRRCLNSPSACAHARARARGRAGWDGVGDGVGRRCSGGDGRRFAGDPRRPPRVPLLTRPGPARPSGPVWPGSDHSAPIQPRRVPPLTWPSPARPARPGPYRSSESARPGPARTGPSRPGSARPGPDRPVPASPVWAALGPPRRGRSGPTRAGGGLGAQSERGQPDHGRARLSTSRCGRLVRQLAREGFGRSWCKVDTATTVNTVNSLHPAGCWPARGAPAAAMDPAPWRGGPGPSPGTAAVAQLPPPSDA